MFTAGMARARTALVLLISIACWLPAAAAAQLPAQSLATAITGPPALGVAADGQAVLAWSDSTSIVTSVRPAGGTFGPGRRISTGTASRVFALGVGRGGDAVVVWQRTGRTGAAVGSLLASVRRPRGSFSTAVAVPGSRDGRNPSAAVAPNGSIVVAWEAPGDRGCGPVVEASIARPGRVFSTARRVSGACPSAKEVRTAMSSDGTGVVVWRAGRALDAYRLEAAAVGHVRFGVVRRVSRTPVVGFGAEVGAVHSGGLVVWRDRASVTPAGTRGRVLAARVTAAGVGPLLRVSTGDRVAGVPRVAGRPNDSALVVWEEGGLSPAVLSAAQAAHAAGFGAPELVDQCGANDASRTYASPALDGVGGAAAVYQTGCMARFGLGTDYGIALARRLAADAWQAPQAVSNGRYGGGSQIGAADSGELVVAWVASGVGGGLHAAVVPAQP